MLAGEKKIFKGPFDGCANPGGDIGDWCPLQNGIDIFYQYISGSNQFVYCPPQGGKYNKLMFIIFQNAGSFSDLQPVVTVFLIGAILELVVLLLRYFLITYF